MHILGDINKNHISTPTLRHEELLVSSDQDFTVGYYKGCYKLNVCSPADIEETCLKKRALYFGVLEQK